MRGKQQCAPLPSDLELADRAIALDSTSKDAWRQQLKTYVDAGCHSLRPVSGRAFTELFQHLVLEPQPLSHTDVDELVATYRAVRTEQPLVQSMLKMLAQRTGWREAMDLAACLAADGAQRGAVSTGRYVPLLNQLRERARRHVDSTVPFQVRVTTAGGHTYDSQRTVVRTVIRRPLLVDQGLTRRTYVGLSGANAAELKGVDVIGNRIVSVYPVPADPSNSSVSLGERFRSGFSSFVQGLAEVPAGLSQSIAIAANWLDERGPRWMSTGLATEELATYRLGEWIREKAAEYFPTNPELAESFIGHMVPNALGNLIGFAAGGGVTALVRGSMTRFAMVAGSSMEGSSQYQEAMHAGAGTEAAQKAFGLGLLLGTTEAVPFKRLLARVDVATGGKATGVLKRYGLTAIEEFVQEWTQTVGGNAVAQAFYDENRSLFEGAVDGAAAGGTAAALFHGIVAGAVRVRTRAGTKDRSRTLASGNDGPWVGPTNPEHVEWFTPAPWTLDWTQRTSYWMELQRTLDAARNPNASAAEKIAHIRRVSEGSNVPFIATLSQDTEFEAVVTRQRYRTEWVQETAGNCKNAAVVIIETLAEGGIATPLQSEYTKNQPRYSPEEDFAKRGKTEAVLSDTANRHDVVNWYRRHLKEGQLGYLRTGNYNVGHATAVINIDGQLYSINNQKWYQRLGIAPGRLQTLDEFLADWERWSRNPAAYGDTKYASYRSDRFAYRGFSTTYRLGVAEPGGRADDLADPYDEYVR